MTHSSDDKDRDRDRNDKDKSVTPEKARSESESSPVSGPTAPAVGGDEEADKTESNRKGGYGTG